MTESSSTTRDASGRFQPGVSGNPAGRPAGRRNDATILRERLRGEDVDQAVRVITDKIWSGNLTAARVLLDRLEPKPKPRARPVEMPLTAGTREARCQSVFAAMAAGELTPDEAIQAARVIEIEHKIVLTTEAPERPPALPDPMNETPAQTEARLRERLARDAAVRAEVTAALRAELEPIVRAEIVAAMRAELVAELRRAAAPEAGATEVETGASLFPPSFIRAQQEASPPDAASAAVPPAMTAGGGGEQGASLFSPCSIRAGAAPPRPVMSAARVERMLRNTAPPPPRR